MSLKTPDAPVATKRSAQQARPAATTAALKQTIDFTRPDPARTANYSLPLYQGCDYNPTYTCWSINYVDGFFKFNLKLDQQQGVNLIFQLCSSIVNGTTNCPISITVNGQLLVTGFDPHITSFYDMVWSVPASMLKAGDNEIVLKLIGGNSKVFMRYAIVDLHTTDTSASNWLQSIDDSLPLGNINLPGTHDSAAINTTIHTPYACHRFSITDQLNGGVRLLDVRLKVQKTGSTYSFVTCHGDLGSSTGVNEYQSFTSLMDECKTFLASNTSEMVVMTLKVDDWNGYNGDSTNVLNALADVLSAYPVTSSSDMQTLGSVRSKIVLYNRINSDLRLGVPIGWSDNTSGSAAYGNSNRNFSVYVQDQYKGLPTFGANGVKTNLVTSAFGKKANYDAVLNYASATWYGVIGVYIMGDLLSYFGANSAANRPAQFGWTLFDYQFEKYNTDTYGWMDIVQFIISSNHNYSGYENPFNVIGHDEL
ncbi:hypothetical protein [Maricaulis sp.]|uniref:hypothetical protein n=1 Tax=Maricaulis sp. TaxID=1486257 RepID=UPI002636D4AC|nr:hypothetical protein [Maricaulis sp.]